MLGRTTSLGPVVVLVVPALPLVEQLPIGGSVTTFATEHDGPEIVPKKDEELKLRWEVGSVPCNGELIGFAASIESNPRLSEQWFWNMSIFVKVCRLIGCSLINSLGFHGNEL